MNMSQAIEQLIRLHDAQAVSIESFGQGRGKGILSKEQQIAAFAAAQRKCPVGFDVLQAKHRGDSKAAARVRGHAIDIATSACAMALAPMAAVIAVSVVLGHILPTQQNHIASLLRRHSRRGQSTRRLVDACNDTIRAMVRRGGDPEYIEMQRQRADELRNSLRAWSESEAITTTNCPRCAGTSILKAGNICPECSGSGKVVTTTDHMWQHMKNAGAKKTDFDAHYLPLIHRIAQALIIKESEATDILHNRIRAELRGAA